MKTADKPAGVVRIAAQTDAHKTVLSGHVAVEKSFLRIRFRAGIDDALDLWVRFQKCRDLCRVFGVLFQADGHRAHTAD